MDVVAFYHVEPLIGVGMPLLITTVTEDERKQWAGEMYMLLQDEACTVIDTAVRVDGNAWPQCEVSLNQDFIQEELLNQARWRFALYRQERGHDARYGLLARPIQIGVTTLNALVAFWMQSPCGEKLKGIQQQTRSALLGSNLKLVTGLPRFMYEPAIRAP